MLYYKTMKTKSVPEIKVNKKFKTIEKDAKDVPTGDKDIKWEGEEISTQSETKLSDDKGSGQAVVLRFFDFGANAEAFKIHKPSAQELLNSHLKGIEAMLWRDGLKVYPDVQPRFMISKDKKNYRFIIACLPSKGNVIQTNTLTELLTKTK